MRRKARRTWILSAAGVGAKATGDGEIDDGIRTGWVCVNVGRVESGELPVDKKMEDEGQGFVGFGTRRGGCSVVVQMLTEEKRGELDMERLWLDMLEQNRRENGEGEAEGKVEGASDVVKEDALSRLKHASSQQQQSGSANYYPSTHVSNPSAGQQLRAYQTFAR